MKPIFPVGNLPIEGTNSTRFGLFHGLIAGCIVVIVASVALGLFGLFSIYRERAEVAAMHNQSPSTTPSVMIVDDPQKAEEAFSGGVGHIGRPDVLTGALKGTNPAGAAPELPPHPVEILPFGATCFFNREGSTTSTELSAAPCVYQPNAYSRGIPGERDRGFRSKVTGDSGRT